MKLTSDHWFLSYTEIGHCSLMTSESYLAFFYHAFNICNSCIFNYSVATFYDNYILHDASVFKSNLVPLLLLLLLALLSTDNFSNWIQYNTLHYINTYILKYNKTYCSSSVRIISCRYHKASLSILHSATTSKGNLMKNKKTRTGSKA